MIKDTKSAWHCRWCGTIVGTLRKPAYEMAGHGGVVCKACVDAYVQGISDETTPRAKTITEQAVAA